MASLNETSQLLKQPVTNTLTPVVAPMRGHVKSVLTDAYFVSVQSINMGFMLAAALAWNEAVKKMIERFVGKTGNESKMLFMYAFIVSILAAVVFSLSRKFLDNKLKKQQIQPVLFAR
jgi:hypothetical protein